MNSYVSTIIEYARRLSEEKVCGKDDCISIKALNGEFYATKENVDFANLQENDVLKCEIGDQSLSNELKLHATIYSTYEDVKAICHSYPAWVVPVSKSGKTMPAVLDDMAQIVGPTCKTANNDVVSIIKNLKGRNSCLVKDSGCITTGRSMDEAYTCVLVLDKASHCFVASAVIGKNVIINGIEARLMRFVYKKKYSKANQANLQVKEEE